MDWSDDVAYSVHDVEDAIHAGLIPLAAFGSEADRMELIEIAHQRFGFDTGGLREALDRLIALDYWPRSFDGSMRDLVHLKTFTSHLIGRFSVSAQVATQVAHGSDRLTRYAADLVVPDEVRHEVAVMKAVAVRYVMNRPGAEIEYARQRERIAELVHALVLDEGRSLDPWLRPTYQQASDDAQRRRVIIDQVASLTDVSILAWHARMCA